MSSTSDAPDRASRPKRLGRGASTIVLLALTSLFTDISSEMTLNVLPIYLTGALGVSVAVVGIIEGVAESTASLTRLFSGQLSDRLPRRQPVVVAGYGLSALTKPLFALVAGAGLAGVLRFADRVGKGIRTAPRDALLASAASEERRGLAFGFHRAADTMGAVLGILAAAAVIAIAGGQLEESDFRAVALIAAIPAALGVIVLFFIHEDPRPASTTQSRPGWLSLPASRDQRRFLGVIFLFALGNSSDAFIILRLVDSGASVVQTLLLLALMNVIYSAMSTPGGALSDRIGRRRLLLGGYLVYAAIYVALGLAPTMGAAATALVLYGAYYGLTEGASRAFLADLTPADSRGAAYGWFHMLSGIAALPASIVAGLLWVEVAPGAAFIFGSICALAAAALLFGVHETRPVRTA
ncbi:MAG: MFS transporter [Dehalococcoidia bacterium]